jgi:hypothetical protein
VFLTLRRDDLGPVDRPRAIDLLANGLACVSDEYLLERVASFQWTTSVVHEPEPMPATVPTNRYERAAHGFFHTVLGPREVEVSEDDARALYHLLEDALKEMSRVHGGRLYALLSDSVWARLRDALAPLATYGGR